MLTEQEIRETLSRHLRAVLPGMIAGVAMLFVYFAILYGFRSSLISLVVARFGETARELTSVALIVPAFAVFLVPACLGERQGRRYTLRCPLCSEEITRLTKRVIATRCCPRCSGQIVEGGRARSSAVYQRYSARKSRRFLAYFFWTWPALGLLAIICSHIDPSIFQDCPQCLWMTPLLGVGVTAWAWLRTFDRRYVAPLLASLALVALGAYLFWKASQGGMPGLL